jgi:hypothetical protein
MERQGNAWHDMVTQGAWHDMVTQGNARHGKERKCKAWHGVGPWLWKQAKIKEEKEKHELHRRHND